MIEPNWNLFLWFILILWGISGISHIVLGAMKKKKDTHWDTTDIFIGITILIFVLLIILL